MQTISPLDFAFSFLEKINIQYTLLEDIATNIPISIDKGLRAVIYSSQDYKSIFFNNLKETKPLTIYRFYDEYNCHYILLRLYKKKSTLLFIGPYLKEEMDGNEIGERLGLSQEKKEVLENLYSSIPIIDDENILLSLSSTLTSFLWKESFSMEYMDYPVPDKSRPLSKERIEEEKEALPPLSIIEENYKNEEKLMDAVSKGKLQLLTQLTSSVYKNGTKRRLPDSLRNRKNYLIIFNTLLRKAAEKGGVHPINLDRISSHFASEIEQIRSIRGSIELQEQMAIEYCLEVKKHSLKKYSYFTGKAITIIDYDIKRDLSLSKIADEIGVAPSYLSAVFSKDTGKSLTEYVHNKRMEIATSLLSSTDLRIQDIAEQVGISDANYFSRLFHIWSGMTPGEYRKHTN